MYTSSMDGGTLGLLHSMPDLDTSCVSNQSINGPLRTVTDGIAFPYASTHELANAYICAHIMLQSPFTAGE